VFAVGGEGEAGANVLPSKLREVGEDLVLAHAARKVREHVTDRDSRPADDGLAEPDGGVDGDTVAVVHASTLSAGGGGVKASTARDPAPGAQGLETVTFLFPMYGQCPHLRYDVGMNTPSTCVINLRTPAAQRELIDRAAQLQGKSRTEFMLEASREKAQQVLLDQTLFSVTPEQYEAFLALMEAPLIDNAALQRLLAKRSPWEQ